MVRVDYAVVFVLCFLAVCLSLIFVSANTGGRLVADDAYVTLTYARNLLSFHRFTFDGQANGASGTSPLHAALIAVLALVTRSQIVAVILLGIAGLSGAGVFGYYWSKSVTGSRRIAALSSVLVTSGWMVFDSLSGWPTALFLMLLLCALYLFERQSMWFGVPLALAVMTSADAWSFALGMGAYALVRRIRDRSFSLWSSGFGFLLFGACTAVWLVLSHVGAGSLLPGAELAKAFFFGEAGLPLRDKLHLLWNGFVQFYGRTAMPLPLVILPGLLFAGLFARRYYLLLALLIFYGVHLIAFPGGLAQDCCRAQHVLLPFLMLVIAGGSIRLVWLVPLGRGRWILIGVIAALLAGNQLVGLAAQRRAYVDSLKLETGAGEDVARYLSIHTRPGDRVAAVDVGALSVLTRCRTIDLTGTVDLRARWLYRDSLTGRPIPLSERNVLAYVLASGSRFLVVREDSKRFLNFDPDLLPDRFTFLGESKPVAAGTGGYRVFALSQTPTGGW